MRVLIIAKDLPSPALPNAGIFVVKQARALADLGHEILAVRVVPHAPPLTPKWREYRATPQRDLSEEIPIRTVRAFVAPRMIGLEYLPLQLHATFERLIHEFSPDIIHAHFLIPCGQLAVRHGVPTIVTAHGSDAYDWAWRRPGLTRAAGEAVRAANTVVAVSDFIRERVRALVKRDVHVVHNGADERIFHARDRWEARAALGLPADRFVIAFVGHTTRAKGFEELTGAVRSLADLHPILAVAGRPDDAPAFARAARGIDCRLFGVLAHEELATLLAAADVFCLPSHREGLPASICEAMLSARSVVATPVGGIPEIVEDEATGFLVPRGDTPALAARLRTLASDPALAARMGEAGARFAQAHLTWAINARAYDRLYRELRSAA